MHTFARISILCLLFVGHVIYGQDDFFEVFDFDTFGTDIEEEDLIKDRADILPQKTENTDVRLTSDAFKNLCEEYEILLDNQRIDCSRIKLNQRTQNIPHEIQKRQADETEVEGSGDDAAKPEENEPESPDPKETPEEPKEEESNPPVSEPDANPTDLKESDPTQDGNGAEPPAEEDKPLESAAEISANEDIAPVDQEGPASPVDEPKEDPKPDETEILAKEDIAPVDQEATSSPVDEPEKDPQPDETETPAEKQDEIPAKEDVAPVDQDATTSPVDEVKEDPQPDLTEPPAEKEEVATEDPIIATTVAIEAAKDAGVGETVSNQESTTVAGLLKKGRKLLPGNAEINKSPVDETPKEKVQENQSGNAVVESPEGATMEQHEHVVNSMAASAKIKEGEEPKSGESAKDSDEGRKDTKVLIILFVAVVVVGGAAFAYNFIKKRKQTKANTTADQNGDGNVLKRSLQNLTKSDPEQGTEMKPLMRPAGEKPVVAEYNDEKQRDRH